MKTIIEYLQSGHIAKSTNDIEHIVIDETSREWGVKVHKTCHIEEFDFEELKNGKMMCLEFNANNSTAPKPYMYFYCEHDNLYALLYLDNPPTKEPTKDELLKHGKLFGGYQFSEDKLANVVNIGIW